jgi:hypothetical protein
MSLKASDVAVINDSKDDKNSNSTRSCRSNANFTARLGTGKENTWNVSPFFVLWRSWGHSRHHLIPCTSTHGLTSIALFGIRFER